MAHAIANLDAAGESTRDTASNPTSFRPGAVDVAINDGGSFSGTIQLRRAFRKADGSLTDYEAVSGGTWTEASLPVHEQFEYVPGYHWELYCSARSAGSVNVMMGN